MKNCLMLEPSAASSTLGAKHKKTENISCLIFTNSDLFMYAKTV